MTPARQKAALQGISNIATKVYDVVPIAEAWDSRRIASALTHVTRTQVDLSILRGCLNTLKDSCLVREVTRDVWQRTKVRECITKDDKEDATPVERPLLTLAKPEAPPRDESPLQLLGAMAERLRSVSDSLTTIAGELETVALLIEESRAESEGNLGKLRQLQTLLKDLSLA